MFMTGAFQMFNFRSHIVMLHVVMLIFLLPSPSLPCLRPGSGAEGGGASCSVVTWFFLIA